MQPWNHLPLHATAIYVYRLGPVFAPPFDARLLCCRIHAPRLHSAPTHDCSLRFPRDDALGFGTAALLDPLCHPAAPHARATPVRMQHPHYDSASPLHTTRRRLRSRQPTADKLCPRSSASSILSRSSVRGRGSIGRAHESAVLGARERAGEWGREAGRGGSGRVPRSAWRDMSPSRSCCNGARMGDSRRGRHVERSTGAGRT
ncbi:hypothetical protein C8R45DRAFT_597934 [Mycena sanguinolenta]|nr:hypothetical protein C8R45DRAFT_597934 [Mycena sanguinolenta]